MAAEGLPDTQGTPLGNHFCANTKTPAGWECHHPRPAPEVVSSPNPPRTTGGFHILGSVLSHMSTWRDTAEGCRLQDVPRRLSHLSQHPRVACGEMPTLLCLDPIPRWRPPSWRLSLREPHRSERPAVSCPRQPPQPPRSGQSLPNAPPAPGQRGSKFDASRWGRPGSGFL